MKVVGIIPDTYQPNTGFVVELTGHEMHMLTGVLPNSVAQIRPGYTADIGKVLNNLVAFRSKRSFLDEQARQMRAVAELMEAVAPQFQALAETKHDGRAATGEGRVQEQAEAAARIKAGAAVG